MGFTCAIAPLDQATTSIGWHPGDYVRADGACSGLQTCRWNDNGLQFLADPGTPVVAPFPVTVLSTSPFVVRPDISVDPASFWNTNALKPIRISGVAPAVVAGAQVPQGGLLGRIAAGQRGTKWVFWETNPAIPGVLQERPFIQTLFENLGLYIVGGSPGTTPGFTTLPLFGGKMYARTGGPADCPPPALHGLSGYLFGSAPTGYVSPSSSVYARYGASSQSDVSAPPPRAPENTTLERAAAGGGALGVAAVVALVLWAAKR